MAMIDQFFFKSELSYKNYCKPKIFQTKFIYQNVLNNFLHAKFFKQNLCWPNLFTNTFSDQIHFLTKFLIDKIFGTKHSFCTKIFLYQNLFVQSSYKICKYKLCKTIKINKDRIKAR